jgi:hypothetical protein
MPRKGCSWPELSPGPLQQIDPYDRSAVPVVPAAARPKQHALDVRFGNVPPGFGSSPRRRGAQRFAPRNRPSAHIFGRTNAAPSVIVAIRSPCAARFMVICACFAFLPIQRRLMRR